MRTMTVTSPAMRGSDVKLAQTTLRKSKAGRSYYAGQIDGEYGPLTATAARDAKWDMGWSAQAITGAYGDALHAVLIGKVPLTAEQKKRQKKRREVPPIDQKIKEMMRVATSMIGLKESPAGSNIVMPSRWYGIIGPWCAMFVTYCGVRAGLTAFERSRRWAYCPYMVSDALAGRNGLRARGKTEAPKFGDVVLYDWGGDRIADHVGLFEKGSRSSFTAIEGNTGIGNDSNGGQVMRRERGEGSVRLFARVVR